MPSKYQKYDIATKVSLVEEYLELSKTVKISKALFAYGKGISDSTFNDWVITYQKDKDRFIGGSNNNSDDVSIVSYRENKSLHCHGISSYVKYNVSIGKFPVGALTLLCWLLNSLMLLVSYLLIILPMFFNSIEIVPLGLLIISMYSLF